MRRLLSAALLLCVAMAASAQEMGISTNVVDYLTAGSLNVEASYGFARHWSVSAGGKYSPLPSGKSILPASDDTALLRQRLFNAGLRWWPWHIYSGWWMGAKLQYQEFVEKGRTGPETTEGDRFGGGLAAGYSAMLAPRFNLDLGLGFWGGYALYTKYACRSCGRRIDSGSRPFFLPSDLLLGITYIF